MNHLVGACSFTLIVRRTEKFRCSRQLRGFLLGESRKRQARLSYWTTTLPRLRSPLSGLPEGDITIIGPLGPEKVARRKSEKNRIR